MKICNTGIFRRVWGNTGQIDRTGESYLFKMGLHNELMSSKKQFTNYIPNNKYQFAFFTNSIWQY